MKTHLSIIAASIALLALGSCKKESAVTAKPDEISQTKTKTIDAKMEPYDYTQPVEKIIADAGGANTYASSVSIPGWLCVLGPTRFWCLKAPRICIIITRIEKPSPTGDFGNISGGTLENPIGVIEALPEWPKYNAASEVNYSDAEDTDTTEVSFVPL